VKEEAAEEAAAVKEEAAEEAVVEEGALAVGKAGDVEEAAAAVADDVADQLGVEQVRVPAWCLR
jgi:hypothetical protein